VVARFYWISITDEVLADDMTRQVKAGLSDEEGIYVASKHGWEGL
jgi:hypothetical protein